MPSSYEQAWSKGEEGERRLGAALNAGAAARAHVGVLHDLTLRGKRSNIDHLVIGPAGVTVVDAKAWSGRVTIGKDTLWQGRGPRAQEVTGVLHQMQRVRTALDAAALTHVPVRGALCFVNNNRGLDGKPLQRLDGVDIGTPAPVLHRVFEPGPLDAPTIRAAHGVIRAAFVVHGGEAAPRELADVPPPVEQALTVAEILPPRRRSFPRAHVMRGLKIAFGLWLALTALAIGIQLIGTGVSQVKRQTSWMTRAELRAQQPTLRRLAREAAHGRIRGVRVRRAGNDFVLTYRRGRSCRVDVTVSRLPRLTLPQTAPRVEATGCART